MSLRIGTFKDENKTTYQCLYDSTTNYIWPIAFERGTGKTAKAFLKHLEYVYPNIDDPRELGPDAMYRAYEDWMSMS